MHSRRAGFEFDWFPFGRGDVRIICHGGCFVVGLVLLGGAATHAREAIPRSRRSGQPMLRFARSDGSNHTVEYIYVDHPTQTYFVRWVGSWE